ncbi:hypothetical protein TRFO_11676 [Tritrichomonas foetus]|uniref:Protein kinase domain-containing protein n=1 Tax=Tritrichomonas foetus TaxID=1144522 RepID=A0A1J4J8W5_9EUKA|nr:hypothetical protein TRFO_11676 [Tritrichomonas foetus]|eukprot:OHS93668.1 hypothetical protein TRFO_11676 [Tritrichomonas foetus]
MKGIKIPNQIGDYLLKGTIGKGSFSIVKIAQNLKSGLIYACKILAKKEFSNFQSRFENEIKVFRSVRSDYVVALTDFIADYNFFYVFMEYCKDGELFQYIIDRRMLSENVARKIFSQIAFGLKHLQNMRITHRDLKPENILISESGVFKISDFGLAKFLNNDDNLVKTMCGSPCYAAPECICIESKSYQISSSSHSRNSSITDNSNNSSTNNFYNYTTDNYNNNSTNDSNKYTTNNFNIYSTNDYNNHSTNNSNNYTTNDYNNYSTNNSNNYTTNNSNNYTTNNFNIYSTNNSNNYTTNDSNNYTTNNSNSEFSQTNDSLSENVETCNEDHIISDVDQNFENYYDGFKCDIWSLGIILYAMLTGTLPWTKRNHKELFGQICNGIYKIPDFLSDDAHDLLTKMICVDPNERFNIDQVLSHPWVMFEKLPDNHAEELPNVSQRRIEKFLGYDDQRDLIYRNEFIPDNQNQSLTDQQNNFPTSGNNFICNLFDWFVNLNLNQVLKTRENSFIMLDFQVTSERILVPGTYSRKIDYEALMKNEDEDELIDIGLTAKKKLIKNDVPTGSKLPSLCGNDPKVIPNAIDILKQKKRRIAVTDSSIRLGKVSSIKKKHIRNVASQANGVQLKRGSFVF